MIKNKPLPFKKFLKLNKKATNSVLSTAQEAKSTMVSQDGQERHWREEVGSEDAD